MSDSGTPAADTAPPDGRGEMPAPGGAPAEPRTVWTGHADFAAVVARRFSRRRLVQGGLRAAVAGLFAAPAAAALSAPAQSGGRVRAAAAALLGFDAVPISAEDTIVVPKGYTARPFLVTGTPIIGPDVGNPAAATVAAYERCSGADMEQRIGSHHDGMHYFPFPDDPDNHGLLVVNHEYIDGPKMLPEKAYVTKAPRPADQIRKGVASHGVSVTEIRRAPGGAWTIVAGRYNRRITAETPMEIRGPVRGSRHVVTKYSPDGTRARGTFNNCANGWTPWSTYLTCEENWARYFISGTDMPPRELRRYGVPEKEGQYGWAEADGEPTASPANPDPYRRFNASVTGTTAREDYRNEPNGHGWIVEIDPWNPASTPVKHTRLGRFAHEGCVFPPPRPGQPLVFYSGDDAENNYIYKFVTRDAYVEGQADSRLLDEGTLYVARFDPDGTGRWLPLALEDPAFRRAVARAVADPRSIWPGGQFDDFSGFTDEADLLVNTRLAADVAGATPMDRPEWGATHPVTGEVYFSLTNNSRRGLRETTSNAPIPAPVHPANPRLTSAFGHIIRWREDGGRPAATRFTWDLFVLSGHTTDSMDRDGFVLDAAAIHACPDGLWFDDRGVLWIETDMAPPQLAVQAKRLGNNALLAADPSTGEIRRFFTGPNGQEVTGFAWTPDQRTLFINVQHPGESSETTPAVASTFPDGPGGRGRSCTIVITKDDGGVIGT